MANDTQKIVFYILTKESICMKESLIMAKSMEKVKKNVNSKFMRAHSKMIIDMEKES